MKEITCLFCNKITLKNAYDEFWCQKCNSLYKVRKNNIILFDIIIDNIIIYYDLNNYTCRMSFSDNEVIFPIDKFLVTLPELKEKINNILAYL